MMTSSRKLTKQKTWATLRSARVHTRFIQHPGCMFRIWWGTVGMVLLGFDMVTIPLRFFGLPESIAMEVVSWFARIYWTMDIGFSFVCLEMI